MPKKPRANKYVWGSFSRRVAETWKKLPEKVVSVPIVVGDNASTIIALKSLSPLHFRPLLPTESFHFYFTWLDHLKVFFSIWYVLFYVTHCLPGFLNPKIFSDTFLIIIYAFVAFTILIPRKFRKWFPLNFRTSSSLPQGVTELLSSRGTAI